MDTFIDVTTLTAYACWTLCSCKHLWVFLGGHLRKKKTTNSAMLAAQIRARIQKDNMEHSAAVERIEKDRLKKEEKDLVDLTAFVDTCFRSFAFGKNQGHASFRGLDRFDIKDIECVSSPGTVPRVNVIRTTQVSSPSDACLHHEQQRMDATKDVLRAAIRARAPPDLEVSFSNTTTTWFDVVIYMKTFHTRSSFSILPKDV